MLRPLIIAVAGMLATAPAALAQDSIKIAVVGPMAFAQGENAWAGAEMARDEINKEGGIKVGAKKRKIELVRIDSNEIQSVPDATNAMERAITREKADFVIGGFRSEAVLAMQEVAMDYKKIFLGCGAADAKLGANVEKNYDRYKYWFRVAPLNAPGLGKTLFAVLGSIAGQVRADLKKETPKVAILAEKVIWTEAIVKAAQDNLPKMKMEVVGLWQPSPVATDVTAEPGRTWSSLPCPGQSASSSAGRWGRRRCAPSPSASTSRRRRTGSGRPPPARATTSPPSTPTPRWR